VVKGVLCFSRAVMDGLISLILFEEWDDGQACVCVCVLEKRAERQLGHHAKCPFCLANCNRSKFAPTLTSKINP